MIPSLTEAGTLPPGIHQATWAEFVDTFGTTPHRRRLLRGLRAALENLREAGCRHVYLNGSFVTSKSRPNDFDACWDMRGVNPDALDPVLLTFDRGRAAQKATYGGELFPAHFAADGRGHTFLEFFQMDKEGRAKGIIVVDVQEGL